MFFLPMSISDVGQLGVFLVDGKSAVHTRGRKNIFDLTLTSTGTFFFFSVIALMHTAFSVDGCLLFYQKYFF